MSDYQMRILTKKDGIGHFTVELTGPNGQRKVIGFAPKNRKDLYPTSGRNPLRPVTGKAGDDSGEFSLKNYKEYKSSQPVPLSKEQYEKGDAFLNTAKEGKNKDFEQYDPNEINCVDFANTFVKEIGLKGDVDDYLSKDQRSQMSGATVYSRFKYAKDRLKKEADNTRNPIDGEIGGTPGEEKPIPDRSTKPENGGEAESNPSAKDDPEDAPITGGKGQKDLKGGAGDDQLDLVAELGKPGRSIDDILLKKPEQWTETEVRDVMKERMRRPLHDPERIHPR